MATKRTSRSDGRIRVGTSGWLYPEWRGTYYPRGLVHRLELEYVASRMPTVELNGSFYSLRKPASYRAWRDRTPESFVLAVKGHRFVTHLRQLRDPQVSVANFLGSGVLELGPKLGPVLWQFPDQVRFDPSRLADFLAALPKDTVAAAKLVADHATMLPAEGVAAVGEARPLRHAVEPRHPSFGSSESLDLLRAHDVALVTADTAGTWPRFEQSTADFAYVRLHGGTELYASSYSEAELVDWAAKIRRWSRSGDVYVYFDNTANAAAPHNAERLADLLGVGVGCALTHR
ncbi:MAG TPA: DUF72 domain-containing protein [Pseudonocardiaceae bacterium]|jgi:uncharacterized protein YecE (DUF72 family)|nr:DUF72 domain-containing protein [Pseudonocardiaceae bacterium]